MTVESQRQLSRYRLIERIGEGGMGVVWRAFDPRLERQVAIKILAGELAGDPLRVARFEREAPFQGRTSADLVAAVLRDEPPAADEVIPSLPRQLGRILRHGLSKDPDRRFQTVLDLRNELEDLRAELANGATAAGGEPVANGVFRAQPGSVAVLPLENLSGDPEQEFFADGMTDTLIADLAKLGDLKVISRTSVMQYKGARKPIREIAAALGVGAVVEGSVLRAGRRVRITAQLINAATDRHLWAESYERDVGDVLELQREVASTIARKILIRLTPGERTRLGSVRPVDPRAHEACLKGRYFWYQRTPDSVRKGLEQFRRAVAVDPACAAGFAGIADSYIVDGGRYLAVPTEIAYARAREAAQRAVAAGDELAEAHTSLAAVLTDYDWDWAGADREYRRAIELNPNYVTAHSWYAEHLSRMGRHDQAIREIELARDLDPLSLASNMIVAWILFFARRYDRAIAAAGKTLELGPDYATAHRILGWAYEETGEYQLAIAAHLKASELSGGCPSFQGQLGRAYALAGRRRQAREVLDELLELGRRMLVSPFDVCLIYLALGDRERALDWLERAFEERSDHLPYLQVNPRLDGLRGEPRYRQLEARMAFPPERKVA